MRNLPSLMIMVPLMTVLAGSPARAEIRDHGRVFSDDAISKAKATISDIEKHYHRRIVVETFSEIPGEKLAAYDLAGKDKAARAKFFRDWLQDRAKADGATGVFILICKKPGHVEVEAGTETRKKDFSDADAKELRSQFRESFNENKFDEGLLSGLDFIENTMKAHQNIRTVPEAAKPAPAPKVQTQNGGGSSIMGMVCLI